MFFKKDSFLSTEQKARIVNTIHEAELQTSGEIRIHIESSCPAKEAINRGVEIFNKQKMYDTKDKNGILIYIAHGDRKFAIYGDKGIHAQVPENYWSDTLAILADYFKREQFYAPGAISGDLQKVYNDTVELISEMESELKKHKVIYIYFFVCLTALQVAAQVDNADLDFVIQAEKFYEVKNYKKAIEAYEKLSSKGYSSWRLYYKFGKRLL